MKSSLSFCLWQVCAAMNNYSASTLMSWLGREIWLRMNHVHIKEVGQRQSRQIPRNIPERNNKTRWWRKDKWIPLRKEMLNDKLENCLRAASVDEEEGQGERKRKVRYQPFKLTDECPKWEVGDVFGDREYFRDALRQYAVMSKRPIKMTKNDRKMYKDECKGNNCERYVNLSRMPAYNPNDYVVTVLQHKHSPTCTHVTNNNWISARWLGKRYTEKIKFNPRIPLGSILPCIHEDFSSKLSRMKAYRARTIALEGIYGRTGA